MDTFGLTGIDAIPSLQKLESLVRPAYLKSDKIIQQNTLHQTDKDKQSKPSKEYFISSSIGFKPKSHQQSRMQGQYNQKSTIMKNPKLKSSMSQLKNEMQIVQTLSNCDKKFNNLKTVVEKIKLGNKEMNKTQFLTFYDQKLSDNYDSLYQNQSREKILKGLLSLEKKAFLQKDLQFRENKDEQNKKKYNMLKYEVEQKSQTLNNLQRQVEEIENLFPKMSLQDEYNLKKIQNKALKQQIKNELLRGQELEHMQNQRRKIVLFVKNYCTSLSGELFFVKSHIAAQSNHKHVRDDYKKELQSQYSFLNKKAVEDCSYVLPIKEKLGKKFNEMFEDTLSQFEETNAVKKIFSHEQQIENDQQAQLYAQKKAIEEKNSLQKQKQLEKLNRERTRTNDHLEKLSKEFRQIKQITNIQQLDDLKNHKEKYEKEKESMQNIQNYLAEEIKRKKEIIEKTKEKIKELKFAKEQELEKFFQEVQFEKLDQSLIEKTNRTQELEYQIQKLERTIDGVALIIGRILYQLSNKKGKNVEVKREDLLNSLSVSGLKLERMLTVLFKKKTNFRIESINTDGTYKNMPDYLGLNQNRVYANSDFQNLNEKSFNDADILFVKKDSKIQWIMHFMLGDESFIQDEDFLNEQVGEVKKRYEKPTGKEKEIEQDKENSNLRLKKFKGLND